MSAHLANLHTEATIAAGEAAIDWVLDTGMCLFCPFGINGSGDPPHDDECPLRPYFDALDAEERARNASGGSATPPPPAPLTEPTIAYLDDDDEVLRATSMPKEPTT